MLAEILRKVIDSNKRPELLVIGDLMIDHYIWGKATRLSPEAPVPVVNVRSETTTLGGAANVAQNLMSLGAKVNVAGIIGQDMYGMQLTDLFNADGVDTQALVQDAGRPTTVKTRVLAGSHQLVRVDREVTNAISHKLEDQLMLKLTGCIERSDLILLSDYNKGLFSESFTQRIIAEANRQNKPVIVDPKGLDYSKYKGAYLIKPNRKELAEAAKTDSIANIDDLQRAAKIVLKQTGADYLVVTLSEEGMAIVDELAYKLLPVRATEVFDVTGAGDTVLAAIAYFLASGLNIEESCELANHAAAIVIRRVGSATTTLNEIMDDVIRNQS
jgi:rfaE bifunctional protein kinase chain/domain